MKNLLLGAIVPVVAALLCVALAPTADATTLRSVSFTELTAKSDLIVRGSVEAQRSFWSADKRYIYTVSTVRVERAYKGKVETARIEIRQIGGAVGDLIQDVAGNAKVTKGEEVILFLKTDASKPLHYIVGMAQGKFAVDRSTGDARVVRNLTGVELVGPTGGTHHGDAKASSLEVFERALQKALARP